MLSIKNNEIIAAVFLLISKQQRHFIISSNQLFLNEICVDKFNMIIEYNGIVIKPGHEATTYELFIEFLIANQNWDELILNAIAYLVI